MVSLTTEQAHKQALQIFNRTFASDTGKPFMMCTRCDHICLRRTVARIARFIRHVSPRARNTLRFIHFIVMASVPSRSIAKTPQSSLRHALLLSFSEKHKKMSMSKKGQNMVVAPQKLDHQSAADSSASSKARLALGLPTILLLPIRLYHTHSVHCNTYALHVALSITLRI